MGLVGTPGERTNNFAYIAEKMEQLLFLWIQLKGQEALKAMLGNTKSGSVPNIAASMVCCGSCKQLSLRGKGSALWTVLGYWLPLSTVFFLCIIYYHEVSKQLSHHIISHRDPGENTDRVSGETVSPLLREAKCEISLAYVPFPVCLEGKGDGAIQPLLPLFSSQLFLSNKWGPVVTAET